MEDAHSSNICSNELDDETKEKLKGDVIGDTLYSASFVINTLLGFSNLTYNEQTEEDLTFLWDMTLETDVCKFLFELGYPSLATITLETCQEGRLIEIIIGILANILLANCDNKAITSEQVNLILREFETNDSAILIQLVRFIQSLAYTMPDLINSLGDRVLNYQIQYILNNSQNTTLVGETLKAVEQLTEDFKLKKYYVTDTLFASIVEGFDTIFSVETNTFDEVESGEASKVIKTFLRAVSNVCDYASKYEDYDINVAITKSSITVVFILKIITHFSEKVNLFPLSSHFNEYMSAFYLIVQSFDLPSLTSESKHLIKSVFSPLCKILILLRSCQSELMDSFDLVVEFVGYLIHIMNTKFIFKEFKAMGHMRAVIVLNSIKRNSNKFNFDISSELKLFFAELK